MSEGRAMQSVHAHLAPGCVWWIAGRLYEVSFDQHWTTSMNMTDENKLVRFALEVIGSGPLEGVLQRSFLPSA